MFLQLLAQASVAAIAITTVVFALGDWQSPENRIRYHRRRLKAFNAEARPWRAKRRQALMEVEALQSRHKSGEDVDALIQYYTEEVVRYDDIIAYIAESVTYHEECIAVARGDADTQRGEQMNATLTT